jgi:hypothetical protein
VAQTSRQWEKIRLAGGQNRDPGWDILSPRFDEPDPMNLTERRAWQARCRAAGMDADEVAMVADRYAAYRRYNAAGGGLPLEGWFRFYCLEKESELGDNAQGLVSSCSATGEANAHQYLSSPAPFLALVRDYLALQEAPAAPAKSL